MIAQPESNCNVTSRSSALLLASSRVFEKMSDDRSAEIILLGCLLQNPHYSPALSLYGRLAARNVRFWLGQNRRQRGNLIEHHNASAPNSLPCTVLLGHGSYQCTAVINLLLIRPSSSPFQSVSLNHRVVVGDLPTKYVVRNIALVGTCRANWVLQRGI